MLNLYNSIKEEIFTRWPQSVIKIEITPESKPDLYFCDIVIIKNKPCGILISYNKPGLFIGVYPQRGVNDEFKAVEIFTHGDLTFKVESGHAFTIDDIVERTDLCKVTYIDFDSDDYAVVKEVNVEELKRMIFDVL